MKIILSLITFLFSISIYSQTTISLESGYVRGQYNDVRVPNGDVEAGTLFSFTDDFSFDGVPVFLRLEVSQLIKDRHIIELIAAPLQLNFNNATKESISFAGENFTKEGLTGRYEFNTYRGSYRYRIVNRNAFILDLGATLLVRDARIALKQNSTSVDDTDLGFVPLVSFNMQYRVKEKLTFQLKGDALVGPVGRAEDIFIGFLWQIGEKDLKFKAGYRLIEGGADVDQVYNFAFFHFANIGIQYTF